MSSEAPDTRERILKSTLKLLEAGEGKGVTMHDVAAEAGITRQALYLHFPSRAELLIAATYVVDETYDSEARLEASRNATSGRERLDAYIGAWADFITEIYGAAKALMALAATDEAAAAAWKLRMDDVREGCEAAIAALKDDGALAPGYTVETATDLLWALLSVRNWEALCLERGWPQELYAEQMKASAHKLFVAERH